MAMESTIWKMTNTSSTEGKKKMRVIPEWEVRWNELKKKDDGYKFRYNEKYIKEFIKKELEVAFDRGFDAGGNAAMSDIAYNERGMEKL